MGFPVSSRSIIAELRFSVFNANNERISDGVVRSDSSPAVWQGILAADENYYIRLWAPTDSGVANYIALSPLQVITHLNTSGSSMALLSLALRATA